MCDTYIVLFQQPGSGMMMNAGGMPGMQGGAAPGNAAAAGQMGGAMPGMMMQGNMYNMNMYNMQSNQMAQVGINMYA